MGRYAELYADEIQEIGHAIWDKWGWRQWLKDEEKLSHLIAKLVEKVGRETEDHVQETVGEWHKPRPYGR